MTHSTKLLEYDAMLALNAFFAVFSLVWLAGHMTVRLFDWEFWFALAYLVLAVINTAYFARRKRADAEAALKSP